MSTRIRLYISPFTPDLAHILLSPANLASASNISYHTIKTFPERSYGYLELSTMEADRLKKKLHGSILKGSKIKVEEARPSKMALQSAKAGEVETHDQLKHGLKATKKRRREEGVLPGLELPDNRKVKRGWSDPSRSMKEGKAGKSGKDKKEVKKKSRSVPSAFSSGEECLFRAKLPLSATHMTSNSLGGSERVKKDRKKKKGTKQEVVVHEFTNTTKQAGFLRDGHDTDGKKAVAMYVDGKGWLDADGVLVELDPQTKQLHMAERSAPQDSVTGLSSQEGNGQRTTIWNSDSGDKCASEGHISDDETSSSGSSSDSENDRQDGPAQLSESTSSQVEPQTEDNLQLKNPSATSAVNSTSRVAAAMDIAEPISNINEDVPRSSPGQITPKPGETVSSADATPEVHPLEALFKRPKAKTMDTPRKAPNLEVKTSFSFFSPEDDTDNTNQAVPQTPFTQRDLQDRSLRSAAPTPDTAAPGKSGFGNLWGSSDIVENEDDTDGQSEVRQRAQDKDLSSRAEKEGEQNGESDFAKWFWEHRGETNRAWKRRKREAAKEKRQRENKTRGRSAV